MTTRMRDRGDEERRRRGAEGGGGGGIPGIWNEARELHEATDELIDRAISDDPERFTRSVRQRSGE